MTTRSNTARLLLAWALLAACAGCFSDPNADGVFTVACLGDSNTNPALNPGETSWCGLLARDGARVAVAGTAGLPVVLPTRFVSYAVNGGMVCSRPGSWIDASAQVRNLLKE